MIASFLKDYMPIIIAGLAFGVSLYVAYLSRETFIASQRPFVWASSFSYIDKNNQAVSVPEQIGYKVKNSPAKIIRIDVEINLRSKKIFEDISENFIWFPDESSQRGFRISNDDFLKITELPDKDKKLLVRKVKISYTSLDDNGKYFFELQQSFDPVGNDWKDISQSAN